MCRAISIPIIYLQLQGSHPKMLVKFQIELETTKCIFKKNFDFCHKVFHIKGFPGRYCHLKSHGRNRKLLVKFRFFYIPHPRMQVWFLGLCMESICSMDLVFCLYVCNVFIRFETSSQKDTKLGLRESQNVLQNAGFGTS